jgi:predicted RNase H-like nuclease (RuvC/YqgF family)
MRKNIISIVLAIVLVGVALFGWRSCVNNREYRKRIDELGNTVSEYTNINRQLSEQNTEFEASIGRLEQQLNEYRNRIAKAKRIVTELSADTTAISGELSEAIKTVRRIKEKLQQLKLELDIK